MRAAPNICIGHGYDLHRLAPPPPNGEGRPFVLGGVTLDHASGPVSHSDGDVLYHAVTDAVLGALGEGDIGRLFPDDDPVNEGADSSRFLLEAARRLQAAGLCIGNLDATVILESPRLSHYIEVMARNIASLLACDAVCISIKAKTHEGVDAVGEGRAVEAHVVVLLQQEAASTGQ